VKGRGLLLLGLGFGCFATLASAADWPQWRGPNRDGKAAGFTPPKTWPKTLTQKWRLAVGDGVATPALVGDRLYIFTRQGANEVIRCVDAATGKTEHWKDQYPARGADGPAAGFAGPRCSPTVADGKVVTLGVRGTLSCYDAISGKRLWRKEEIRTVPMFYTASSPIIVDGLCIAQLGGEKDGTIVAYDLNTGDQKWRSSREGTEYASPVLLSLGGLKAVVVETSNNVLALSAADGKVLWRTSFPAGMRDYNAATPMVDGQMVVYTASKRGTRAVRLERQGDALAAKNLWTNTDHGCQYNTPVIKDGLVFGISANDSLFCINAADGKTAWSTSLPARGRFRGYGSVVDAGSVLFALNPSGQLIVFEPSAKEFKQIARYEVSKSETYAYPVVSGNRVFIKDADAVTLYTIE